MNKRISVGMTVALILIAVTITFTATMIYSMSMFDSKVITGSQKREGIYDKLSEIDKLVRQYYYEDVDDDVLAESLIDGLINGLGDDSATQYLTSAEIAQRNQLAKGTVVSVGLEVSRDANGYLVVNKVYSDSPADKVEMKVGDAITSIDDTDVLAVGYDEAVKLLYGVEGTRVTLHYTRESEVFSAEVMYTSIVSTVVEHNQINDIYYIRIRALNEATPAQFSRAINDAEAAYLDGRVAGVIIDVRDLQGGYSRDIVRQMLNNVMPRGRMYYLQNRSGELMVLDTSDNDNPVDIPTAVLVNNNTSGYAELFAASLGELSNCRIIGARTAGSGTMQELHMLADGSGGIDISVGVLYTSTTSTYHETGIQPDYEVESQEEFIISFPPEEDMDQQYKKAAEILRTMR